MNLKGKIHEIGLIQQVSDTFKKRSLVIEYAENPSYPEYISLELQQDKVNIVNDYQVGQEVDLEFNLKGRPWTNKEGKTSYFNTLVIWKIAKIGETIITTNTVNSEADGGDLPF